MADKSKTLLSFAHRGEAQTFLKNGKYSAVEFAFDGVYESEQTFLVITGEGIQNATEKVTAVCAAFRAQISQVVNIGIAASLQDHIRLNEIYSVRTAYAEHYGKVAFKTFTSDDTTSQIDCLTAAERVLQKSYSDTLSAFAPIVDRELWGCASACALFKLPFRSYKLISDIAGDGELCPNIKERALDFSERLYQYYLSTLPDIDARTSSNDAPSLLPDGFYQTTSQKRQVQSLLKSLSLKYKATPAEIVAKINPGAIISNENNPKKRTAIAINALHDLRNPFNARLKAQLAKLCQPLTEQGGRVQFARDYEDDAVDISIKIQNPRQLASFKKSLEEFDYPEIIKILNGETDS